jgi:signal transduction histidine kinase
VDAPALLPRAIGRRVAVDPVLLLPLAVAVGLLASWLARGAGASESRVAIDLAVSWAFAICAALALSRPSLRRSGVLMAAVSATWFLEDLQLASNSLAWTIGWLFAGLPVALVVSLILSYPQGRIWSAAAGIVVVATYLATIGIAFVGVLFLPRRRNPLVVWADQASADDVDRAGKALGVAITVALAALIVARVLHLRGAARRIALPMLAGALIATSAYAVQLGAGVSGHGQFADRLDNTDRLMTILIPVGFLAGLFWSRLRRTGAANLVVELRAGGVESLRDRLARALGDPSLEVVFWLEHRAGYVDARGDEVALPSRPDRAATQILAGGVPVAALIHDPVLLDEPDLVDAVRATAELVLENERLAAEVRAQLAEVRASRMRIVAAADNERRRLERDLHDGAQQRLVAMSLKLSLARAAAEPAVATPLAQAQDDVERALAELREFARGVHPSVLREDGLDAAMEALARRASLPVEVIGEVGRRLPDSVELAAYYFVSEALTNVAKHARASRATVTLRRDAGGLTVLVSDDGIGGADAKGGSGLGGLADRLEALEGVLELQSAPGGGTTLSATIPCEW